MHWYPRFMSAGARRARAKPELRRLRERGVNVQPIEITGRTIARGFWGRRWCDHLGARADREHRLPRGRILVRNGSVCHLEVRTGAIEAMVAGSGLFHVVVRIPTIEPAAWKAVGAACAGRIDSLRDLLEGRLPGPVLEAVTAPDGGLLPGPADIVPSCGCSDRGTLCRHAAAALYGLGSRLDAAPELLFRLRGVDERELLAPAAAARATNGPGRTERAPAKRPPAESPPVERAAAERAPAGPLRAARPATAQREPAGPARAVQPATAERALAGPLRAVRPAPAAAERAPAGPARAAQPAAAAAERTPAGPARAAQPAAAERAPAGPARAAQPAAAAAQREPAGPARALRAPAARAPAGPVRALRAPAEREPAERPRAEPRPAEREPARAAPARDDGHASQPTGALIRQLRAASGFSVAEFAELLRVSTATVRRWEAASGPLTLRSGPREALRTLRDAIEPADMP